MNTVKLFVYGTLKKEHSASRLIKQLGAKELGEIKTAPGYCLYDIAHYPGMINCDNNEKVKGELYEICSDNLLVLDEYEAVGAGLFRREMIPLENDELAVAYLYNRTIAKKKKISDGEWHG